MLLGKRGIEPYKGYWDVPGGFLEAGEHPEEGTKRELLEETGLEIRILGLIGFYMDRYGADGVWLINFYYAAERTGGELRAMDDVEELRWFSPDELPKEFGFAHQYQLMDDLREWLQAR